jgi:D-alanyl-D-alanine carboxypeptidase
MKRLNFVFVVLLVMLVGCQSAAVETAVPPTAIPPFPTDTPVPPTPLPEPTAVPPTKTAIPPTVEPAIEEPEVLDLAALEEDLQTVVDSLVDAGFPGVILMIDAPDLDFSWQGAGGMANVEASIPMQPDTPFRLGQTTKMMTAAVMLRLAEEDMLDLDDPINQYLDTAITDRLNGPDGEPYGEMITIRELLSHTSGVADIYGPTDEEDEFPDIFLADPERVWTPVEAIAFATDTLDPQFVPGESWDYSNTNFILAGLIIEEVTGMSLGEAYQDWLFAPLAMTDTYLASIDDPRLEDVAHTFYNDLDVSGYASLSWLWGAGGVVSTADDLSRFMWAWVHDEIFSDPDSKEAMTNWTSMDPSGYGGISYGLGIVQVDFGEFGSPEIGIIQGHNSMWNGFVYYWPQYNIVFGGVLNQVLPESIYTELAMPAMMTMLPYVQTE